MFFHGSKEKDLQSELFKPRDAFSPGSTFEQPAGVGVYP
jgi:hypothetical protein